MLSSQATLNVIDHGTVSLVARLRTSVKQFFCRHTAKRHLETIRIHAESRGYWGTQIDIHECTACRKVLKTSQPMECAATFDD